jgi:NhaP-type Na+/H+ or K+/H+ antiporter
MHVLPYNWNLPFAMAFGTLLSATDPVAVVGLLKELGASPRMTMIIAGESLMNDGTAIVIFKLFFDIYCGKIYTSVDILIFALKEAIASPLFGILMGLCALFVIGMCSRREDEGDIIIQVSVTITCAYLTFLLAEVECGLSGVLATCGAALTLSYAAWPLICYHDTMHHVWETIEYIGNTLLFMLAGMIVGNVLFVREDVIDHWDFFYLLLLYVTVSCIRFCVIVGSYPFVKLVDKEKVFNINEAMFCTWAGLRGAVAIALAIVMVSSSSQVNKAIHLHTNRYTIHLSIHIP